MLSTNLDAVFFWAQEAARRMLAAEKAGRHRQHRLGARLRRLQGRRRLCHRQGRRDPAHQGAGARTRLQGHPRQRHRAGLDRDRDQRDFLASEKGAAIKREIPDRPLRRGARSRRRAAAARLRRRPLHHRRDHRGRRRPDGGAAEADAGQGLSSWTFTLSPEIEDLRAAHARVRRASTCCRSKPIRRITPTTRTSRSNGSRRCRRRRRRPGCGRRSRRRNSAAWRCRSSPGRRCTRRRRVRSSVRCRSTAWRPTTAT